MSNAPLPLPSPDPSENSQPELKVLNANSTTFTFDNLGPMVINTDGTISRIANWQSMTPSEQERTLRVLVARNRIRYSKLENEINTNASTSTPEHQDQ